ncbi:alkaline phosphatase family protein [Pseudonocardia sp. K10HN5]|uniref:Alkaline phosphatase family protein n=1 Tax=Pseudonocardia acidicola TaxID=2724939 RepID=A0ABX1SAX0_9PSEU|nr:alkaline phosphatase family protein [Pseudonocardia acidicola]NMH98069.1 alkaline phosphatase family protein [Pseudonocardia acidicola]
MPDDGPVVPRYGLRSLAEVLPALLTALGVPGPAAGPPLPPVRAAGLLLIDGLGTDLLVRHATDAPFLAGLPDAGPLTVGFPSSTSVSLATLGTGLPPGEHGIVGISFRAEDDELLNSLRWVAYGRPQPADLRDRLPPERIQPMPTALERAAAHGVDVAVVAPRDQRASGLTRAALRGGRFQGVHALGDLAADVIGALTGPGRRLCYGYHADLDTLGHVYGPGSLPWRLQLRQIDQLAATIAGHLPSDALLAVTGDHGMVQVTRPYDADTDDALRLGVRHLGGDPRSRHVYAHDGAAPEVLAAWRETLGGDAWVVSREQAVADGWFGPLAPHVQHRIGDVVVALRGTAAVIRSVTEPGMSRLPGQHGSLSREEQFVPLLLAHTPQ